MIYLGGGGEGSAPYHSSSRSASRRASRAVPSLRRSGSDERPAPGSYEKL